MKNAIKFMSLAAVTVALTACGNAESTSAPAETVTITATPSAEPATKSPGAVPTPKESKRASPTGGTTPAEIMESSSTNKAISYTDEPAALVITLPVADPNEQAYTMVKSEMSRAIRLLEGNEVSAHIRKIVVKSANGTMLEQTDFPTDGSYPVPTQTVPNDHAPRADDLIIPQPSLEPVPNVPALAVDVSLLSAEGMNGGNYEMYLKVPQSQLANSPAPGIIMKARADSLKGTSMAGAINEVKIYSSDQVLLDSMPIS